MFIRENAGWKGREISRAKPPKQDTVSWKLKFAGKEGPDLMEKGHLYVGEVIAQIKDKQSVSLTVEEIFSV